MQDAGLGRVRAGFVLVYHMVCGVYSRKEHAMCIGEYANGVILRMRNFINLLLLPESLLIGSSG